MFNFFKRQKRTLVEKIVDSARQRIVKKRDAHQAASDALAIIIRRDMAKMKFHNDTFMSLNAALRRLDGRTGPERERPTFAAGEIPPPAPIITYDEWPKNDADDYGLGEELELDILSEFDLTADMGDGRAATESDTLAKINSAADELRAEIDPEHRPDFKRAPELPVAPPLDVVEAAEAADLAKMPGWDRTHAKSKRKPTKRTTRPRLSTQGSK